MFITFYYCILYYQEPKQLIPGSGCSIEPQESTVTLEIDNPGDIFVDLREFCDVQVRVDYIRCMDRYFVV